MNPLIDYLRHSLYTPLLPFLMALAALLIAFKRGRSFPTLRVFPFYFSAYLLLSLSVFATAALSEDYPHLMARLSPLLDLLLTLIEFWAFARFFRHVLVRRRYRLGLGLVVVLFFSAVLLLVSRDFLLRHFLRQQTLQVIFIIQAIGLLLPCIAYFVGIFTYTPVSSLKDEPNFWVVTGLSFMLVCTFPLSLFLNYIELHESALYQYSFDIFYIFYSLLFFMIIRAYLCNPISGK